MKSKLMTKLALVAAVVCAAVGARATPLYFSIDGVQSSDGNALKSESYLAYLFVASSSRFSYPTVTKADILNALSTKTTSALTALATPKAGSYNWYVANTGIAGEGSATWSDTKVVTSTSTYSDDVGGTTGYPSGVTSLFALILDASSVEQASNYMFASKDGSEAVSNTSKTYNNKGYPFFDFGSQSGNSWTTIASINVPEPTSGVLLLVGVAALALRRKKAA